MAVAKNFAQRGIAFECLEREGDIGGVWNMATGSGVVCASTHLVSPIASTGFDDLPMLDEDFPEYPSHRRVLGYLRDYAERFDVARHIALGKLVTRVSAPAPGEWEVSVAGEEIPRRYRGVVIASGHHDVPRMPAHPGNFSGEILHARHYRSPRQLRDQRVLVVGCGNSAADIVSDAVHGGCEVVLSVRRGYWFVPKFILGFPTGDVIDTVERLRLPRGLKRQLFQGALWLLQGPPSRYRMPDPDYAIDQAHPTMSDEIPRLAAHGSLTVKGDIAGYDGEWVLFKDGSSTAVDLIVFATGYQPVVPFIERETLFAEDGRSRFALQVFHPEKDGLFAAGLVQANGSMWRLADYQGQLIGNYILARQAAPERAVRLLRLMAIADRAAPRPAFVGSERHRLEVNYYDYRRVLKRNIRRFTRLGAERALVPRPSAAAMRRAAPAVRPAVSVD